MTIFDLFRRGQQLIARPAQPARQSRRRILGAHFEWLEPRCLMSVAPPTPYVVELENAQYANFYVAPLVLRGQYPSAPQPDLRFQLQPAEDAPSGIAILSGMSNLRGSGFNHAQGVPSATPDGMFNYESRAVREMLSSLHYVPDALSAEIARQPAQIRYAEASTPSAPGSAPPLPSIAPSLLGSSPSLPAITASSPSSAASILRSEPSTFSSSAPTSASPDPLGPQAPQLDAEGGMVSLVRQPVPQASTVDKISVAAIDALLQIPAKVDSMQGRFQAFEISVITEAPLPIASPPTGPSSHLPFQSTKGQTPPTTDPNWHGAWMPPDSAGAVPLFPLSSDEFISTALLTAAASLAGESSPFAELPPAAVDAVFGELSSDDTDNVSSGPRLDIATATLLAVVIGRALWPLRVPKAAEQEKTATSREAPAES